MNNMIDEIKIDSNIYIVYTESTMNCCLNYNIIKGKVIKLETWDDIVHHNLLEITFEVENDNITHKVSINKNTDEIVNNSIFGSSVHLDDKYVNIKKIFLTENEANYYILERCNEQIDSIVIARDLAEKRLAHYLWQLRKIVPKCFKIVKKEELKDEHYDRQD